MSRARSMRPVPRVYDVQGPDLVMERLYGPTMADAIAAGDLAIGDGAGLLADLHRSPVPRRRGRRAVSTRYGRRMADALSELRRICLAFPEVSERPSHGAPTWFVRDKKTFATLWQHGHHDLDFPHLWCAAAPGVQAELIAAAPQRYFRPPYVGHRGWLGVRLDGDVDWVEIAELCEDAYRVIAPKTLVARLDAGQVGD